MPFTFTPLALRDVILVQPRVFGDSRGFFAETYHEQAFRQGGITARFVQDKRDEIRRADEQMAAMAASQAKKAGIDDVS